MLTFSSNFFKAEILVLVLHFSKAPIKIAKISIADFSTLQKNFGLIILLLQSLKDEIVWFVWIASMLKIRSEFTAQ